MNLRSPEQGAPPPVEGTVYGVVLNDRVSLERFGDTLEAAPYRGAPKAPAMYVKPANTLVGEGATVRLPAGEGAAEIGATVGIVIGAPAGRLRAEAALDAVAGYLLVADLSLPHSSYYRPAIREKCFDGACPMAASVTPVGSIADLSALSLSIEVDGRPAGERSLGSLLRDVPQLLADVTEFMSLSVGDVLLVGVEYQAPQASAGSQVRIDGGPLGSLAFRVDAQQEAAR